MKSKLFFRGTPLEDLIKIRNSGNDIQSSELGKNLKFNTNLYSYREHENTSTLRKDKDFPEELIDYIYDTVQARRNDTEEKSVDEIENFRVNFSVALLAPKYINFQDNQLSEYIPYVQLEENTLFSKKKEISLTKQTAVISGIKFDFYVNDTNQIVLADIGMQLPPPPVLKINKIISRAGSQFQIFNHQYPIRDISEIENAFSDGFTDVLLDNNVGIINSVFDTVTYNDINQDIDQQNIVNVDKSNDSLVKSIRGVMNVQDAESQMILYSLNTNLQLPKNLVRRDFMKVIQDKLRIGNFKRNEVDTDDTISIQEINIKNFLRTNNILRV